MTLDAKTIFEEDLAMMSNEFERTELLVDGIEEEVKGEKVLPIFTSLRLLLKSIDVVQNFLLKYNKFLDRLDETFGTELKGNSKGALKIVTEM